MKNMITPFPDSTKVAWTNSVARSGLGTAAAVTAGMVVKVHNAKFGVAFGDIATSAVGQVYTEGVFDVPKNTGVTYSIGDHLGYDFSNNYVTTSLVGGIAFEVVAAAASSDTTVRVRLNPRPKQYLGRVTGDASGGGLAIDTKLGATPTTLIIIQSRTTAGAPRTLSSLTWGSGASLGIVTVVNSAGASSDTHDVWCIL